MFSIVYEDCKPLKVQLDNTTLSDRYLALLEDTYNNTPNAICRDPKYYTLDVLKQLAVEASNAFDWNWDTTNVSLDNRTLMHKDIENLVGNGYENIPEEYDELVHNIHFGLHAIESDNNRGPWLQIEWWNDDGFKILPEEYPAKIYCEFGDIKLQNPFVGHNPLFVYGQNDYRDVDLTCKFHDFCKPGINIIIHEYYSGINDYDEEKYKTWFYTNAQSFVEKYSWETILAYTGEPVVGRVTNLDVLEEILEKPYLKFKELVF